MKVQTLEEQHKAFRVTIALKIVLGGIICILINNIFHLNLEYFSLLFLFLIMTLAHGEVLKAGSHILAASIISGLVSLLLTYLFIDSKVLYVFIMSVWIFIVVSVLVRYFLALLISSVSATMIMYNSIYSSVTDANTTFGYYLVQLILAIVVCIIIDRLVWPNRSRRVYQLTLRTVYKELAELFMSYTKDKITDRRDHGSTSISLNTFNHLVVYINRMQREEGENNFPIDQHMKIITFTKAIYIKLEVLEGYMLKEHVFMEKDDARQNVNEMFTIISDSFKEFAESIGTKIILSIRQKELDESIMFLHDTYRNMHEVEGKDNDYYEDLISLGAMLPLIDDISDKLKKITDAINLFHGVEYEKILLSRVTHTDKIEAVKRRSFLRINKENAKVGIKTVVIFLLLMFGEAIIGLPGGGQVVFFAILFGIIPNLGQAYMKSRYGVLGVTLGIALSIVGLIVLGIASRFFILLSLYSLGTFIAAYIASSSKDISLTGLQAGLLFPFSILYVTGPGVDIEAALTRFLALFSSIFIGLIVQHLLWPSNPFKMLKEKVASSISFSGKILSTLIIRDRKDTEEIDKMILPLVASLPTSSALLHDAEYLLREDDLHSDQFISMIESIERIYAELETLKRVICQNIDSSLFESLLSTMKPYYMRLDSLFENISGQFDSRLQFTTELSELKADIEKQREEFRSSGVWRTADPKEVEKLVLLSGTMDSLLESLGQISQSIGEINQSETTSNPVLRTKEA